MPVVLDSSMSLTWCLPDQASPIALRMYQRVLAEGALVPIIWHLEMANILSLKFRSANLLRADLDKAVTLINRLSIVTDQKSKDSSFDQLLSLMSTTNLSIYDATYVHLAIRSGLSLATFDKAMTQAAVQHGVPVNTF